jgi:hypothetical protein
MENSCPHQAQQENLNREVQGPLPKTPLHTRLEGFGEGREAEAIATTQYVLLKLFCFFTSIFGYFHVKFPPKTAQLALKSFATLFQIIC